MMNVFATAANHLPQMAYVHGNGMKHHLVKEIEDWPRTSLHFPAFINPIELWLD